MQVDGGGGGDDSANNIGGDDNGGIVVTVRVMVIVLALSRDGWWCDGSRIDRICKWHSPWNVELGIWIWMFENPNFQGIWN